MGIDIAPRLPHKAVINGVYETNKVLLNIGQDRVVKRFKTRSKTHRRRYCTEKEALNRLRHIRAIPSLLHSDDRLFTLEMSRLPGESTKRLNPDNLRQLGRIVEQMLDAGVARHSMPVRDIVVDQKGRLGLVDFERATLRPAYWRPDWPIATLVARYHLYRLIQEHQPQLLSAKQARLVAIGARLRGAVAFIHTLTKRKSAGIS
ncbi:phosphotransferase [Microbulbifer sp. ARAS458-1]|uniref:phosphotransferase n=1 Tax=Microbulbifer sp. ARAS458-1 TaxID=3140242 RepID=UPI0038783C22